MTDIDNTETDNDAPETPSDRRALLAKLAVGGAGAAVGAVALGRTASAADGDEIIAGDVTDSEQATILINVPPGSDPVEEGPSSFSVANETPPSTTPFPARVGGYGDERVGNGVHGSTISKPGFGVVAANLAEEPTSDEQAPRGLAVASQYGPQIFFQLLENPVVGKSAGAHSPGEMYVDAAGTLWFTVPVGDGEDGVRFVKLAGTPTSGSLELLPVPVRVADTRRGFPGQKPTSDTSITISVRTGIDGAASGVANGARAALLTVTVANTEDRGFFSVYAADEDPDPQTFSAGNWVGENLSVGQSATSRLSPDGEVKVFVGGFGTADVVLDVIGFYL